MTARRDAAGRAHGGGRPSQPPPMPPSAPTAALTAAALATAGLATAILAVHRPAQPANSVAATADLAAAALTAAVLADATLATTALATTTLSLTIDALAAANLTITTLPLPSRCHLLNHQPHQHSPRNHGACCHHPSPLLHPQHRSCCRTCHPQTACDCICTPRHNQCVLCSCVHVMRARLHGHTFASLVQTFYTYRPFRKFICAWMSELVVHTNDFVS